VAAESSNHPRWAVSITWLALVPAQVELSPFPVQDPARDPNREEYPRDRDKSSSEQVAKRPSGPTGTWMNSDDPGHRMRSAERTDGEGWGSGCRRS
jgi:hypothetical protein